MPSRISTVVTKNGDKGTTTLSNGRRLAKNDPRIQCLGEVDELNAAIGLLICEIDQESWTEWLLRIQHDLFDLGAELSLVEHDLIHEEYLNYLESCINELGADLKPLKEFILPGGSRNVAQCHVARTVCRRAERNLFGLAAKEHVNASSLVYLNRLSDLLFNLGRALAMNTGKNETYWKSDYSRVKPDEQ